MFKNRRVAVLQACEHLKQFISVTVDRYHEQAVDPATVKLALWNEVQTIFQRLNPAAYRDVAWFRVSDTGMQGIPQSATLSTRQLLELMSAFGKVLTVSRLGPRPLGQVVPDVTDAPAMSPTVVYVAAQMTSAVEAAAAVLALEGKGFEVRDWWYGGLH